MTLQRLMATAAIAAALAIPASGFAQPANSPSTTPPAAATSPTSPAPHAAAPSAATPAAAVRHIGATDMRASKLIGATVYDQGDQKLGTIADLVVDQGGRVSDVVIGLGDKNVAVKMADLKQGKDKHWTLSHSKDALSKMGAFDLSQDAAKSGSSTR